MLLKLIASWFDNHAAGELITNNKASNIAWGRIIPFIILHLACGLVLVVGYSDFAVAVATLLYLIRMFAITGFYHRYFSHRTFKTFRPIQFLFAFIGASAAQRGPLWWAAHHRHHHAKSDTAHDPHSPRHQGFLASHMGWFLRSHNFNTQIERIRDLIHYPELRFIDRFDIIAPLTLMTTLYALGAWLELAYPSLNTNGWQLLVWGFAISTVFLYHMTFTVNSLAHLWGKRRFNTSDDSRNNFFIALFTLGEGWHNNHHHFPGAARQGFYWWEIDFTYYLLKLMSWLGLVWDLKKVPAPVRNQRTL